MNLPSPEEVEASCDILYERGMSGCRIVGLEPGLVVKYGTQVFESEAQSLSFVEANTNLPVPKLVRSYRHKNQTYIVMTRIPGKPLVESLSKMSVEEIKVITSELKTMLDELRALRITDFESDSFIGSIGHGPCRDDIFRAGFESKGPFDTEEEMHENILERWTNLFPTDPIPESEVQYYRRLYSENSGHQIRFTHGDITSRNIMVENGHISGIVDWGQAGWYPEYWAYIKSMAGSFDHWETIWPLEVANFLQPYDFMRLIELPIRSSFI